MKLNKEFPTTQLAPIGARPPTSFAEIASKESFPLAVQHGYAGGALQGATEHEAEEEPKEAPIVPGNYMTNMGTITKSQLALAGHRIPSLLASAAK